MIDIAARRATEEDIPELVRLYRGLEAEMVLLHPMWPKADGLDEPVETSFREHMARSGSMVLLGTIDGIPFGFLLATTAETLVQGEGEQIGVIKLIFVEQEAREVGVAEAMRDAALDEFRSRGIKRFDAHVLPGHRLAKNFFEAGGFSARSIVMHHDDERE
jgi:GNAT superfamily N-acetyltransferase